MHACMCFGKSDRSCTQEGMLMYALLHIASRSYMHVHACFDFLLPCFGRVGCMHCSRRWS